MTAWFRIADRMHIETIDVQNFKSLVDFRLDLAKFTCLIGLNGAGKSTVLQFIDFMARQVRGDIDGWLADRNWQAGDVNSRLSPQRNITFRVTLREAFGAPLAAVTWEARFNTSQLKCITETISTPAARLRVQGSDLHIEKNWQDEAEREVTTHVKIHFRYQGSILSQLREDLLPPSLNRFKTHIESIHSLDLLSPEYLRQRTRASEGVLGLGGQKLSAFLHELGEERRQHLTEQLQKVYPQLNRLHVRSLRSGWKSLESVETYADKGLVSEARHMNDGMLRLIAILAELQSGHTLLLFDEIENGINPELVEFVLNALMSGPNQVLVTTHHPLILNYMEDDMAQDGVMYLYRTEAGHTKAIPFFSIPSLAEKLRVMGPGEAFVDTDLIALSSEIRDLTQRS